ncbi:aldo/keto reductase [Colletotrichum tofieldiae]|uniref:Aldo/keto reductase n=1 Tax=Colletotrichum tofieldiae TaxID=708197 RepID=A0A166P428_9PEZI|nr:aldo/keto reductase [Colletotrichum tofieldiae]
MATIRDRRTLLSNELKLSMQVIDGDIVQAIQALKETKPDPEEALEIVLQGLVKELEHYNRVHDSREPDDLEHPFKRGERQVIDAFAALFPNIAAAPAISRTKPLILLNGLWQLSSPAWGCGSNRKQEEELIRLVQSGFTAADMADHYGDAELVYAHFRNRLSPSVRSQVLAATKWCVFAHPAEPLTSALVFEKVKERYRRLGGRVELLQFHWHDYSCKDYLNIMVELVRLTAIHPDLVSTIGLCNFDSEHTVEVCEYLLAKTGSIGIVSNQVQVQFSLIDSRPLHLMVNVCAKYGLKLLTYGSLCGGFLSAQWLGQVAPDIYADSPQLTPSQRKYHDMIMRWGTWQDFQDLLYELCVVAKEHRVSLTNVATRWVLQQPSVGAVIVGTRLGVSSHVDENLATFRFALDDRDLDRMDALALGRNRGKTRRLFTKLGDCGGEYRSRD